MTNEQLRILLGNDSLLVDGSPYVVRISNPDENGLYRLLEYKENETLDYFGWADKNMFNIEETILVCKVRFDIRLFVRNSNGGNGSLKPQIRKSMLQKLQNGTLKNPAFKEAFKDLTEDPQYL